MKFKKTLSLILALIMIAAAFGVIAIPAAAEDNVAAGGNAATTTADTSWYEADKNATEYILWTADQLDGLAKLVNDGTCNFKGKTIKLGADIAYNSGVFTVAEDGSALYNGAAVSETNAPRIWPVIGGTNNTYTNGTNKEAALPNNMFLGDFDGNGKAISGLYVNVDAINVGLFSVFGGESFKNTSILNSYFRGNGNIGSFAGRMKNSSTLTLEGLYSDAIIVGNTGGGDLLAGGITSLVETTSLTVNKCAFEGKFVNSSNQQSKHMGGLIGETFFAGDQTIENCFVNATFANVNADQQIYYWGGIIGITANANTNLSIKNVLVIVNIENINKLGISGAFVGSMYSGGALTVDNSSCYYITNHDEFKKGTNFKKAGTANVTEVTAGNNASLGTEITKPSEATGLSAEIFELTETTAAIKGLKKSTSIGNAKLDWYMKDPNAETFTISTADELDGLAYLVNDGICNFEGKTVKLGADIAYNSGVFTVAADGTPLYNGEAVSETNAPRVWPIIGVEVNTAPSKAYQNVAIAGFNVFRGSFDGQEHAISGLYVNNKDRYDVGLFSVFAGETLKSTYIINSYFHGKGNMGSFAGRVDRDYADGEAQTTVTFDSLYSNAYVVINVVNNDALSSGIAGGVYTLYSFKANKCVFEGSLINISAKRAGHTGGIVGWLQNNATTSTTSEISNCLVNATFDSISAKGRDWGGIVGTVNCQNGSDFTDLVISNTLVIIDTANEASTFDAEKCNAFIGLVYRQYDFAEINNSYCILKSDKYANAETYLVNADSKITVDGTSQTGTAGLSVDLLTARKVEKPTQATGLSADVFVLTDTSAAVKNVNACFEGHSYTELFQRVEASCEGDGHVAHYKCNNCSKLFDENKNEVDSVVIPTVPHTLGEWVEAVAPTTDAAGVLGHYECSVCHKYFDADKNELASIEGEPKLTTTTKKPDTTNAPTTTVAEEQGCGGCSGFAAVGSLLALLALTGAALVIKKK